MQGPQHIGIILDGNGRWAKKRLMPRLYGHKKGVEAVKKTIVAADKLGIKALSFYAFSTENWKRNKTEIDGIFELAKDALNEAKEKIISKNFQFRTMGDISKLPQELYNELLEITEKTKNNTGLIINMGLNYGSKAEIVRAINQIIKEDKREITEKEFENYLYTTGLPPIDFVIRTSGEQRLSNFMLYQIAYAELYFPKTYWPSFNEKKLKKAIKVFKKRDRRFGKAK